MKEDREEIIGLINEAILTNQRNQMRSELQKAQFGQQVPPSVQNTIDYSQAEITRLERMLETVTNGDGAKVGNGEQFISLSAQFSSLRADFTGRVDVIQEEIVVLAQKVDAFGNGLADNAKFSAATARRLSDVVDALVPIVDAAAASQRNLAEMLMAARPTLERRT